VKKSNDGFVESSTRRQQTNGRTETPPMRGLGGRQSRNDAKYSKTREAKGNVNRRTAYKKSKAAFLACIIGEANQLFMAASY
jgi:hypothetical protein